MCTYKSLILGAKTLEIIYIANYQAHGLLLQTFSINFMTDFFILYV